MEEGSHDKKHMHKQYMEHKELKKSQSFETAAWTFGIIAVVLAILFVAALATKGFSGAGTTAQTGKTLTASEIQTKTQAYLDGLLKGQGQTATIDSVTDAGDLYSMKINIGGKVYDSFARKDGTFLFPSGIDLTQPVPNATAAAAAPTTPVPKTNKPKVELFVMSYCPYGTQEEKGILPAVRALGDKVDFQVKFVYYAMHGKKEVDENLRQYCIQNEQPDKYISYLACFLNASDSPTCIAQTGVDQTKLDACVAKSDTEFNVTKNWNDQASWLSGQFPLFNTNLADNQKYGVAGSPTLVINGVQSSIGRDSASFLKGICDSFSNAPSECQQQLSAATPGPGFGYDSTAAATAAGCGV